MTFGSIAFVRTCSWTRTCGLAKFQACPDLAALHTLFPRLKRPATDSYWCVGATTVQPRSSINFPFPLSRPTRAASFTLGAVNALRNRPRVPVLLIECS